jgi:two-component system sensor histidine kinase MprB
MTISRRLALAAAGAVAIAVILASLGAYVAVRSKLLDEVNSSLQQRARVIQRFAPSAAAQTNSHGRLLDAGGIGPGGSRPRVGSSAGTANGENAGSADGSTAGSPASAGNRTPPSGRRLPPPPAAVRRFGGAQGIVQLVTADGSPRRPPGEKGAALPVDASTRAVARGQSTTTIQDETVDGARLRVLTAPLAKGGAVEIALPLGEVDSTLSGLIELLAAIAAGGIALAALLGLLVARTSLAPVRRFTARTEQIASRSEPLGTRLADGSRDELGRLARSYNATLEALERSVVAQRQLVSDASHELRTPLTSLRTNLELLIAGDGVSDGERHEINVDLVEQVDELTRLVEEIVELARNGEQPASFVEVRLADIVPAALELVEPHADGVRFELDLAEAATVRGEPQGLIAAVRNLLENAVKWSRPQGLVEITVAGGCVEVRDHGAGIAEEDLPHVFERFYRAPSSRRMPGSGLGLAIVRQVADAHGARASAANAGDGGAVMRLELEAVAGSAVDSPGPVAADMQGRTPTAGAVS